MDTAPRIGTDPVHLPAHVLAREIAARRLSPVDVVEALLARIERLEPKLRAFVDVYADDARLAAEGAEKAIRSGHAVGPLHGIPVALKDLVDLEGRITTGGSAHWRSRRSAVTATIARRMIAQGMIVLGKTHTVEFAYGGWGTNQHMGTPWNPWDLAHARTPGGSSSGSGVAVAARLAPWAIGTDTGGSVRLPAAFCGLTGLKVTIGRISTHGIIPLSTSLDTPGPMARDVEDVALLYNVLQGPDPLDPNTRGITAADPLPTLKRGVRGLRLARMPASERIGVDDDVLAAYDRSLATLAGLGAEIVDVALPFAFSDFLDSQAVLEAEAYFNSGHLAGDPAVVLDEAVRARVLGGAGVSAQDYLATKRRQVRAKQAMAEALAGTDALLTPSTAMPAIRLDAVDQAVMPSRFTRFGNFLEICALSLPNGFTAEGLPLSLQICCPAYEEAMTLRIGFALQQATDHHLRIPPMLG
ncbi:amidase [Bosea sp. (in: a-proteobacteria)]|uniref:amidase n=1 Tax=Bosea sp. (in: a-proteobacteria) TaxID=1871050 RepID=UPI0027356B95|nr:amidase [Bosea sp. (in: a-proteobacteria)]MDP3408907.1 amidase [Bosea sp. (in: a-proteobacteria)]